MKTQARRTRVPVRQQVAARGRPLVLTVGHSTRTQKEFLELLRAHNVRRLADVRSIPRSRHNPQFNRDRLAKALRRVHISYVHLKGLGGLRRPSPDSPNGAWRNASFRGFADYMQTAEFRKSLRRLIALAKQKQTALMCAEAVPWRCHRSLIGDALVARGYPVEEIESAMRTRRHRLTPWARVKGRQVTYPPEAETSEGASIMQGGKATMIRLKRAYDPAEKSDGARYLVERLWPRGMKKAALRLDAWFKEAAPSPELRQWFGHEPKKWPEFRQRYFQELEANAEAWKPLLEAARRGTITLLSSAHDREHNAAVALKEFLESRQAKGGLPGRSPRPKAAA